jgi:hypothetical protein
MKTFQAPDEQFLFNPSTVDLDEAALRYLSGTWMYLMRTAMLATLPAKELGEQLSEKFGRPSKELFSMCGLLLIKDYFGWTIDEAVYRYRFDRGLAYALNLQPGCPMLSNATVYRYQSFFREKELGKEAFLRITSMLIKTMEISMKTQRLDSTHVFSKMARLGRRQTIASVILNFLRQLKRHCHDLFAELPEELRKRYAGHEGGVFASTWSMRQQQEDKLDSRLLDDLLFLAKRFAGDERVANMTSLKHLLRVAEEQLEEAQDGTAHLKKAPGGKVLVNPSDPDAEISGKKGPGFQAQVMQTCGDPEKPNLVTTVVPQGASVTDGASLEAVLDTAEEKGMTPERLLCDAGYGAQANMDLAAERGLQLFSPCTTSAGLASATKRDAAIDHFEFDKDFKLVKCANGCTPLSCNKCESRPGASPQWAVFFRSEDCEACPFRDRCRARRRGKRMYLNYSENQVKNIERRKVEKTSEFKDTYRMRGGIEGLFGSLKQYTALGRLRVRGHLAVYNQIYSVFAMHNIMHTVSFLIRKYGRKKYRGMMEALARAIRSVFVAVFGLLKALLTAFRVFPVPFFGKRQNFGTSEKIAA